MNLIVFHIGLLKEKYMYVIDVPLYITRENINNVNPDRALEFIKRPNVGLLYKNKRKGMK